MSLGELAAQFGLELIGDPSIEVSRVATLSNAAADGLTFLANPAYRSQLAETAAGAVLLDADSAADCPVAALVSDNPYLSFARIAAVLHPEPAWQAGKHPAASIDETATLGKATHVAANAVIAEGCRLGDRVYVGPGCVVERGAVIGDDCRLLANCTIAHDVVIGARVIVHQGAVIGSDGFGNAQGPDGWVKVPQTGSVRIGDDVEIGANTTIDRGAIDDTVIENGARLDNLVQIAHNVRIGEHTAIAGMVGIAGSTTIGKRCMLAGQAGFVGHLTICDDVVVGGATMVSKDITQPGFYTASFPAEPDRDWKRKVARFRRMDDLARRVGQLEKKGKRNE